VVKVDTACEVTEEMAEAMSEGAETPRVISVPAVNRRLRSLSATTRHSAHS